MRDMESEKEYTTEVSVKFKAGEKVFDVSFKNTSIIQAEDWLTEDVIFYVRNGFCPSEHRFTFELIDWKAKNVKA